MKLANGDRREKTSQRKSLEIKEKGGATQTRMGKDKFMTGK